MCVNFHENWKGPGFFLLNSHGMTHGPNRRGTAVDVYAFGCLMIELFGERKVWGELVRAQIMQKICGSFNVAPEPPVVEHLPNHYKSMCKSCCQLDPAKRPHIATVVKQLEAFSK